MQNRIPGLQVLKSTTIPSVIFLVYALTSYTVAQPSLSLLFFLHFISLLFQGRGKCLQDLFYAEKFGFVQPLSQSSELRFPPGGRTQQKLPRDDLQEPILTEVSSQTQPARLSRSLQSGEERQFIIRLPEHTSDCSTRQF